MGAEVDGIVAGLAGKSVVCGAEVLLECILLELDSDCRLIMVIK